MLIGGQNLFAKPNNKVTYNFVLGNVGVSGPLHLLAEIRSYFLGAEVDSLSSVVFDLGAFIRFHQLLLIWKQI